ncbi:unnamed protein product [Linum tenue]|uniref:Cytochrome b561 domain-containing protein n=1 Tax=Linum tenue TaxID=586396 RepID=A0AAV0R4Z7_9ROSI|nr:unnamed protein product [Linum tenue]
MFPLYSLSVFYEKIPFRIRAPLTSSKCRQTARIRLEMAPPQSFSLPLLLFARTSALTVAALLLYWALAFNSHHSSSQHSRLYAARHMLLMVIGFILVSGEAILVHRWLPCSRNGKKLAYTKVEFRLIDLKR